ncbi:MAG: glycerol-3-phosphate dehydrogenase [Fulvimarina sp.]|nr:glycerol-3-phosphate dehydrogenase [Fulvimarina sp.]
MSRIVILGAGVMGSALAVPARDNGHEVILGTTPLDADVLAALTRDRGAHPRLKAPLDAAVAVCDAAAITPEEVAAADLVIVGVSSPGIEWAADQIVRLAPRAPIAIVTKGLVAREDGVPQTYADALPALVSERGGAMPAFVGIGGPCIARELAERRMTAVVYASHDRDAARHAAGLLATDSYDVALSDDVVGVEACAALKNFLTIGVSAMMGAYRRGGEPVKNPVARAFQQAVDEMTTLCAWLGGEPRTAQGLAGLGDLHVTVGGGRNSRLGVHLGEGLTIAEIVAGPMQGETVEGVDVARSLKRGIAAARAGGALPARLALTDAIIAAVEGAPFDPRMALGAGGGNG